MHNDFADWYRICTTGTETNLTNDILVKRWAAVEKISNDAEFDTLELVRLTLRRPSLSADFLGKFRAAFKEADATFQMSGNDLELNVLAGSALCQQFAGEGDEADKAALGLLCARSIVDEPEWARPFVSQANDYLDARLRELRKPEDIRMPQLSVKKIKQQNDAFAAKLVENQPPQNSEAAKQMCEAMLEGMTVLATATTSAIDLLQKQSRFRRQETDVLWWLTARISRDTGKTFVQLKAPAGSIIAGKELADLVSPPGVLPAKSILQSIVPSPTGKAAGKPIALNAAINATDTEWRQSLVAALHVENVVDLCPLLAAARNSLTTDEVNGWLSAYKKAFGFDPMTALQPLEMAHEMYRECLLARLAM
jgi:hypothetical protein